MNIVLLNEKARDYLPAKATVGSAGVDLHAILENDEDLFIKPQEHILINTGIGLDLLDSSLVAFIYSRSSMGHKEGIILSNGVGVIDSDYQGEILVSLFNTSSVTRIIRPYQRIAQLIIQRHYTPVEFQVKQNFMSISDRGAGGFGSTGQ